MQPFENIYSYSISNEIYQQLTQHTVGHTPYKIEGKQCTYITMKMLVNFTNLFSDKTLKSVCFLYVKAGFASTSPTT